MLKKSKYNPIKIMHSINGRQALFKLNLANFKRGRETYHGK